MSLRTVPPDTLPTTTCEVEKVQGTGKNPCPILYPCSLPRSMITICDFQALIRTMYYKKDVERGAEATFLWLMEEIGELASALRSGTHEELGAEFADVFAWLTTIANVKGIDLTDEITKKYGKGCPGCGKYACNCPDDVKM